MRAAPSVNFLAILAYHCQRSLVQFWGESLGTERQVLVAGNQLDHIENGSAQGFTVGKSVNDADVQRMNLLSLSLLYWSDGACLLPSPAHAPQYLTATCRLAYGT